MPFFQFDQIKTYDRQGNLQDLGSVYCWFLSFFREFFLQILWFSSLPETLLLNPNSTWKNGQKELTHGIFTAKSLFIYLFIIIIIIIIITVILLALIEWIGTMLSEMPCTVIIISFFFFLFVASGQNINPQCFLASNG